MIWQKPNINGMDFTEAQETGKVINHLHSEENWYASGLVYVRPSFVVNHFLCVKERINPLYVPGAWQYLVSHYPVTILSFCLDVGTSSCN